MSHFTSRTLIVVGAIALCVVLGFVVGKAMAGGSAAYALPGASLIQSDVSTPVATGSLASNSSVNDPTEASNADANDVESDIVGIVTQVDSSTGTIALSTSTGAVIVAVDAQTEFGDGISTLTDIRQGMSLNVSAQQLANGQIVADSVDVADSTTDQPND